MIDLEDRKTFYKALIRHYFFYTLGAHDKTIPIC